jgi:ABC-type uncharacterized transport system auxiliary subunit
MPRVAAALSLLMVLAGCFSLTAESPRLREYTLAYQPPALGLTPLPVVLRVAPFQVASAYGGQGIIYRDGPYDIGSYPYDHWITDPGSMVTDLLARDLSASGAYRLVQQAPSLLPSDYELGGWIGEIEERLSDGCSAHLRLRIAVRRLRGSRDRVVLNRTYSADRPCNGKSTAGTVAAMSEALEELSGELQRDVHEAIAGDLAEQ